MENASKALLIAGAVLICIVLISVGMVIVNSSSEVTDQVSDITSTQAVQTFNNQFSSYAGSQKGSSVKKLLETIATSNSVTSKTSSRPINVSINDTTANYNLASTNVSDNITAAMAKIVNSGRYTVSIDGQDSDGFIDKISITRQ